jgi:hypothetical protein
MNGANLPWIVKGDIDGFFGLWMALLHNFKVVAVPVR